MNCNCTGIADFGTYSWCDTFSLAVAILNGTHTHIFDDGVRQVSIDVTGVNAITMQISDYGDKLHPGVSYIVRIIDPNGTQMATGATDCWRIQFDNTL